MKRRHVMWVVDKALGLATVAICVKLVAFPDSPWKELKAMTMTSRSNPGKK